MMEAQSFKELPVKTLREILSYDPDNGKMLWKARDQSFFAHCKNPARACSIWNAKYAGKEAGTDFQGYKAIGMKSFGIGSILAHRAAWAIYYGEWPEKFIDHANRNRSDNRITNLRVVTKAQNQKNLSVNSRSKTGINGVSRDSRRGLWRAYIGVNGRQVFAGRHICLGVAIKTRRSAEMKHGFTFLGEVA